MAINDGEKKDSYVGNACASGLYARLGEDYMR
jgi:hypothetical protein